MDTGDWVGIVVTVAVGFLGVLLPLLLHLNTIRRENVKAHAEIGRNVNRVESELSSRIDKIDARDRKRALAVLDD